MRARGLKLVPPDPFPGPLWSRPMRARGLKQVPVGVRHLLKLSRPMRARGLKPFEMDVNLPDCPVAPHAGAWIETHAGGETPAPRRSRPMRARGLKLQGRMSLGFRVRSRPMRARGLKPGSRAGTYDDILSRPMRARGLKQERVNVFPRIPPVAPHAGAWIETNSCAFIGRLTMESRPMRARGLKPAYILKALAGYQSRPMRARGLKPVPHPSWGPLLFVAPHAGAWIETPGQPSQSPYSPLSRPMRARGLKLSRSTDRTDASRRAPCGRVD